MAKKRTVVPQFGAHAKPGIQRNAPPPPKGKSPAVRVKPQSTSAKSGQRGQ
ncbi:MAG: hypothetical protein P3B98_01715 [Gemmatimonadota bacterium]|nr:hypothetical protein [Gemmatimonadota bacterium]